MDDLKNFWRNHFIWFEGGLSVLRWIRIAFLGSSLAARWRRGVGGWEGCGEISSGANAVSQERDWSMAGGVGRRDGKRQRTVTCIYDTNGFVRIWGVRGKKKSRNPQSLCLLFS